MRQGPHPTTLDQLPEAPPPPPGPPPTEAKIPSGTNAASLRRLRWLWAALLALQALAGGQTVWTTTGPAASPPARGAALAVVIGLPVLLIILGLLLREQAFKRHWRGHAVAMAGYALGCAAVWLACTAAAAVMLAGLRGWPARPWLPAAMIALALLIHLTHYPTGRAMRPRTIDPRLYRRP